MAPTRTSPSIRASKMTDSKFHRNVQPPTGYNHKRVRQGLHAGVNYKSHYEGVHEGPEPFHYPLPLPVVEGMRPVDPRGPSLKLSDLECIKPLGMGAHGRVLLVRTRGPAASAGAKLFALKAVRKKGFRQWDTADFTRRNCERAVLVNMGWNPFVTGILQAFHDDRNVYLMLEYSPCGTLDQIMGAPLSPARTLFYFANIVCGLEHLEKSGVVNRDIKPANILVGADGYLCLCDFGPALDIPATDEPIVVGNWLGDGTAAYQAPEGVTLDNQPADVRYGPALDWWSAGVILYEMATGALPFEPPRREKNVAPRGSVAVKQIWDRIMAGPPSWPGGVRVGRNLKALVKGLLTVNANTRLGARGAAEVRQHPWLRTCDWNKMRRKRYIPTHLGTPTPELSFAQKPLDPKQFPGLRITGNCLKKCV
ncbi:kinase-like domain-containing protein [Mycena maculata]|uniref:Kinase-like domain-containing protein n=1 Tax=Mycena maculata TaxID=230809 RepID=A0AAD7ISF0_9AGAR|nr:kinase-like domain-containing protein [Mycena maculata]